MRNLLIDGGAGWHFLVVIREGVKVENKKYRYFHIQLVTQCLVTYHHPPSSTQISCFSAPWGPIWVCEARSVTRKRHDDWTGADMAGRTELRAVSDLSAAISCKLSGHFLHLYHLSTSTFFFKLCLHIKLGLVCVASYLLKFPWCEDIFWQYLISAIQIWGLCTRMFCGNVHQDMLTMLSAPRC